MYNTRLVDKKTKSSTQKFLPISGIRNDCLVLKDGTLRGILLCSSINFALKSEKEQNAIISGYINFINSLEWPIQILIQSRQLNIDPYLESLSLLEKGQVNDLLRLQMRDYINYVRELVKLGGIMLKKFFIVIPYNPLGDKKKNFIDRIFYAVNTPSLIKIKREQFEHYRSELFKRLEYVASEISSIGVNAIPLDTQSLVELFYNIYNPTESVLEKIDDIKKLKIEEIK